MHSFRVTFLEFNVYNMVSQNVIDLFDDTFSLLIVVAQPLLTLAWNLELFAEQV